LLTSFSFPACFTNENGHFTAVNEAFLKTYRFPLHEILGQTPWVIAAKHFPTLLSDEIQHSTANGGWSGRVLNHDSSGDEISIYLITKKLNTQRGVRQLGLACLQGQEEGLMRAMADHLCSALSTLEPPTYLSPREQEATLLLKQGHSQKEIAWQMKLACSTVRVLLTRIRAKQRRLGHVR
jgi:hypothetical protein